MSASGTHWNIEEWALEPVRLLWFVSATANRIDVARVRNVLPLLRFVNDFYRPDLGVIYLRRKGEQEFALAVGMETVEFADYRPECARRCLKDIEVLKQQDAIAGNVEDSTP